VILHIEDNRFLRDSMALVLTTEAYALSSRARGTDAAGQLKIIVSIEEPQLIAARFALADTALAQRAVESRTAAGNVIVTIDLAAKRRGDGISGGSVRATIH